MALGGTEGGCRGGVGEGYSGGVDDGIRDGRGSGGGTVGNGTTIPVPLEEASGSDTDELPRGTAGGRIHLEGSVTIPQGGRVIPWHWYGGGGVKGVDGHSKFPPHHPHCLLQRPP